jgi:subtilisin family serine protease
MRFRAALLAGAVAVVVLSALPASGAPSAQPAQVYIVQMVQDPVVSYNGGIAGLEATKPAKGKKADPNSDKVKKYVAHLKAKHDEALSKVGGGEKLYDYDFSYNGFAASLTEQQAAKLEKQPDVVDVTANELHTVNTATTPGFLGLEGGNGLWSQLGGVGAAGENVVIGTVDSGITPESLSFTDRKITNGTLGEVVYGAAPSDWHGACIKGEDFKTSDCNLKLIGARYFNASWGGDNGLRQQRPWEFESPRDYNGHGTHTAGTSGGNNGVPATGAASIFGNVSGIAPRARVAAYKALWSTRDASTASGFSADLTAAIDQAVEDGVDVINYSVSGTQTNFLDPVQVSFLFAADAGVFVSVSAGNSGPGAGTVAHPSPWYTTVAAETHDRVGEGSAVVDGVTYAGASAGTGSASGQLVTFGTPGSPQRLCFLNSLNSAAVAGKIVFCERGVNARVEKSFEVQRAGGIGMILVNPPAGGSLNADLHFVPTVHLQGNHYAAIEAAAVAGKSASISGRIVHPAPAPFMAAFSSRGPSPAAEGDLLKPDVGAPGVDVLAAVAPPGSRGREFDLLSGTSMSAPHVAGLGALFTQLHPDWSPMAIKSALMTTGSDVLDSFAATAVADASGHRAFAQGGGHVQPNAAANPGLVYDSDIDDWFAFLQGQNCGCLPPSIPAIKASNMNLASIQINGLAGSETVERRVTNVGTGNATYRASTSLSGFKVDVNPSSLTLAPGETKSFQVTFTRTKATLNTYTAGTLTWSSGRTRVESPVVVRPVPLSAPAEVTSNGAPVSWQVTPGYDGSLSAAVGGLLPATQTAYTVTDDPDDTFAPVPASTSDTFKFDVTVPNGALLRAGIFEDAITPTGTDLDMFVFRGSTFVAQSADGDSNEVVTTRNNTGAQAVYSVYVHGFDTGPAHGPANGTLFSWVIGSTEPSAGNTTITGVVPARSAVSQTHTATFNGLAANTRYLGEVRYSDGSSVIGRTLLNVRTP